MQFKGTKGIYYTSYIRGIGNRVMSNDKGKIKTICTLNQNNHEDAYNGKLLSKAPEMLEMLKECLDTFTCNDSSDRELKSRIEQLIKSTTII